jgi:hypothetical protein
VRRRTRSASAPDHGFRCPAPGRPGWPQRPWAAKAAWQGARPRDAGCGGTARLARCMLPARGVSGLFPGRKTGGGTARERLRYRSNSVVSKRRKVTFLSKRHARVRRGTQPVNGEKQANKSEHFGARLHRKLLSPDECCLQGGFGLLKACGSHRENRQFCSDCGAPISRRSLGRGERRIFPAALSGGRSGSSSPAGPGSAAGWSLPAWDGH